MRLVVSSLCLVAIPHTVWPGAGREHVPRRQGGRERGGGREGGGGGGGGGALSPMLDLLLQLLLLHGHKNILIVADYNETSNPQQD